MTFLQERSRNYPKRNNSIDQMIEENKPAEESFGQEMENEMSEELSEEIPQELPQVSTDIGDLLVEEPIPEEIEAAKELDAGRAGKTGRTSVYPDTGRCDRG